MRKIKPASILTAAPGGVPYFIRARFLSRVLGLTPACIYWRVKHGRLPPYDGDASVTKGWLASTLDEKEPVLMKVVRSFYAAQIATSQDVAA